MKFFIDKNLGRNLAEGMRGFGEDVEHLEEVFPPDAKDEDWLEYLGKHSIFLITRDESILKKPAELESFRRNKIGAFFLSGKQMTKWDLIVQLVTNWVNIKDISTKTSRPFAFKVRPHGKRIDRINL
jgi:hypothetical protein